MERDPATGVSCFYFQGQMFPLDLILCFFFHVVNQLSLPPFGEVCPFPTGLSGYHCYASRLIFLLFHSLGLLVYCCNTTLSYCYFNVSFGIRWSEFPILLFKVTLAIVDLLFSLICIGICISAFAKNPVVILIASVLQLEVC